MTNKIKKRYNRIAGLYDIMEVPMEAMFSKWRKEMLKDTSGKILEVGIGTGKNISYYGENVDLTGIDFSDKMISKAKERVAGNKNIQLLEMDAQQMQFDDNAFDMVVTSCVFCSVPNPVEGLREIRRVCKNGGKILMLEHVLSNKKVVGPLMDAFKYSITSVRCKYKPCYLSKFVES